MQKRLHPSEYLPGDSGGREEAPAGQQWRLDIRLPALTCEHMPPHCPAPAPLDERRDPRGEESHLKTMSISVVSYIGTGHIKHISYQLLSLMPFQSPQHIPLPPSCPHPMLQTTLYCTAQVRCLYFLNQPGGAAGTALATRPEDLRWIP